VKVIPQAVKTMVNAARTRTIEWLEMDLRISGFGRW
jgi:hypothetical protein